MKLLHGKLHKNEVECLKDCDVYQPLIYALVCKCFVVVVVVVVVVANLTLQHFTIHQLSINQVPVMFNYCSSINLDQTF